MNPRKNEQLTVRIRMLLADIISREISDPRIESVVINRVELASDGSYARIFVSTFSESTEEEATESLRALIRAAGYIRRLLSSRLGLRTVPELRFVWDDSVREGERVLSIIRSMNREEEDEV